MRYQLVTPLLALALLACEGPAGPAGPQGAPGANGATGPQGPTGQAGPGTRLWFPGTTDFAGSFNVTLPATAGSINRPPVITCYRAARDATSGSPLPEWIVVGGYSTTLGRCGLAPQTGNPDGPLRAWMDTQPAAWPVGIAVVY